MSLAFDLNGRDGSLLRSSPTLCLRNSWLLMSHYAYNFIETSDVLDPAQEIPPDLGSFYSLLQKPYGVRLLEEQ